jgi:hypothetical protein
MTYKAQGYERPDLFWVIFWTTPSPSSINITFDKGECHLP